MRYKARSYKGKQGKQLCKQSYSKVFSVKIIKTKMSNRISDNLFYIEPFAECLNHVNWRRMLHFFQMLLLRLKAQVITHFYESFVKWGASSQWASSLYYLILLAEPPENWPTQKWPILGRGESGRSKSTWRSQSEHMCD